MLKSETKAIKFNGENKVVKKKVLMSSLINRKDLEMYPGQMNQ